MKKLILILMVCSLFASKTTFGIQVGSGMITHKGRYWGNETKTQVFAIDFEKHTSIKRFVVEYGLHYAPGTEFSHRGHLDDGLISFTGAYKLYLLDFISLKAGLSFNDGAAAHKKNELEIFWSTIPLPIPVIGGGLNLSIPNNIKYSILPSAIYFDAIRWSGIMTKYSIGFRYNLNQ